jgi:hypothetical protein
MVKNQRLKKMNFKASLQVLFMTALAAIPAVVHAAPPYTTTPITPGYESIVGAKPAKDFRGRYRPLVKSLNAGQVRSLSLDNVYRYGTPYIGSFNNKLYWMVPVEYSRLVHPGNDLHARGYGMVMGNVVACVRHGCVEHWIYKKSMGLVP